MDVGKGGLTYVVQRGSMHITRDWIVANKKARQHDYGSDTGIPQLGIHTHTPTTTHAHICTLSCSTIWLAGSHTLC